MHTWQLGADGPGWNDPIIVLCDMLTRRSLTIAASKIGRIPPMPKLIRERQWVQGVGLMRVPRRPEVETAMATTKPKKPALHGAAAESHSKAEAAKAQVKSANAKSGDTGRMGSNAGNKSDSGKKSR